MKKNLIHCSYHKCLTVYYIRVLTAMYNKLLTYTKGYTHFDSEVENFYRQLDDYHVASVNNHKLDFDKLGEEFRISRFIRDPRDIIVSGYLYHKKGAEDWCNIVNPADQDWKIVNGHVPDHMPRDESFSTYLQGLSKEEGLKAEIDFRKYHLESMQQWPERDERIKLFRYRDIMGNEPDVFEELFEHYGISWAERKLGRFFADRFSASKRSDKTEHIRDPRTGQWQDHFTPEVEKYFEEQYGTILERYGFE